MLVKNSRELVELVSKTLQDEGVEAKFCDVEQVLEMKAQAKAFETKANEVVHTGNAGFGAELVADSVFTTDFLDIVPRISPLLSALNGYHGRNMNQISKVPVIGELQYHTLMAETTTSLMTFANAKAKLPTAYIQIEQKKFFLDVDVSDEEVRFVNVVDMVATIQRKLAISAQKTQEAFIINGDTETGATGNVNSDDAAPASDAYYLGGNGLRKAAISLSKTVDAGVLAWADYLDVLALLEDNYSNPADIIFIENPTTYVKSLGLDEFKDYAKNGRSSTIFNGSVTNIAGSDLITSENFKKTEADGKISATAAANTKGGFLACHRNAVQYGYNGDYQIKLYEILRKVGKLLDTTTWVSIQ